MSMSANSPIAIIGAGISGLTLARDLLRRGILSTVYEKSPPPATKGRHNYGITLSAHSCSSLALELSTTLSNFRQQTSVDSAQGHVLPSSSSSSSSKPKPPPPPPPPSSRRDVPLRAHRGRLDSLLAADLDIRWGHDLCSVDTPSPSPTPTPTPTPTPSPTPSRAPSPSTTLRFQNGAETTASLVVGADGVHSVLRALLAPRLRPRVLPYVVFRGQRRVGAADFQRCFSPVLRGGNVLELRKEGFVLAVAVDGRDAAGDVLVGWYYSRRARPGKDVLYRPDRGVGEANVIPQGFFEEMAGIEGVRDEPFGFICDAARMRSDRIQSFLMRRVVSDGVEFKDLAEHGIVFLGDAAHATPIIGSEGADYAIQDALDLADVLDKFDMGPFTKGKASPELERVGSLSSDRLRAMILEFYESKLSSHEGTASWKSMGENAEKLLATMHSI